MEQLDVKFIIQVLFPLIVGGAVGWAYIKFTLAQVQKDIEDNKQSDAESEGRIIQRLDEVHNHLEEDVNKVRESIKLLFEKHDRHADAFGDIRVVLTHMASKFANPHVDRELLDMIRDIGKKKNGR